MGWMLRLLILALVVRLIWMFASAVVAGVRESPRGSVKSRVALVRDPVCGTYVRPSPDLSVRAGDATHYFCSRECQRSFARTA